MKNRLLYYILLLCTSVIYAQDPPQDFEFNQSTSQSFYSFSSFQILEVEIEPEDWIGAFNIYDETLSGVCNQDYINFDETLNGTCLNIGECMPGVDDCIDGLGPLATCTEALDIDGNGLLSFCACPDVDNDGLILTQNIEISVGARMFGDCAGSSQCDVPVFGYDGECYSAGYLNDGEIPFFKIYDSSADTYYYAFIEGDIIDAWTGLIDEDSGAFHLNGYLIADSLSVTYDCNNDLGGIAFLDNCNVCSGGNTTHLADSDIDCHGDCFGFAFIDGCGDCVEGNTGLEECQNDCNGDLGGSAFYDDCSICSEGNTANIANSIELCLQDALQGNFNQSLYPDLDCNCDCFGSAIIDDCSVCTGGLTGNAFNGDSDCSGVCFGNAEIVNYCLDFDGDGFGQPLSDTEICNSDIVAGCSGEDCYVSDCTDLDDNCDANLFEIDCAGICDGSSEINLYCIDSDEDGLGNPLTELEECSAYIGDGYVQNCSDINDLISCPSNLIDECEDCIWIVGDTQLVCSIGDLTYEPLDCPSGWTEPNQACQEPEAYGQSVTLDEDSSIFIELSAFDPSGQDLIYVIDQNFAPENGNLELFSNNVYKYTPNENYYGSDLFRFYVINQNWVSPSATVFIEVEPLNDAPELGLIENITLNEGASTSIILTSTDLDNIDLTYSVIGGSDETIYTEILDSQIIFYAFGDFNGTVEFIASVSDSELVDNQSFNVTALPVNDLPEFTQSNISFDIDEDSLFEFDFSNYVFDIENDNLSIIFDSANNNCDDSIGEILYGSINIDNLSFDYTPFPDIFIANGNCLETIVFRVFDGTGLSEENFSLVLNILPVNDGPSIQEIENQIIDEDASLEIEILVADIDNENLTITVSEHENASISIENNFLYLIPEPNFNGLIPSIEVVVSDGELSDSSIFNLAVTPVNDTPELTFIESQSIDEGSVLDLTLSATDIDDGDILTFDVSAGGNNDLQIVDNQLILTPPSSYNGSFDVTVLVSDQGGLSDSQIFTLTVNPVNDPPVIEAIDSQQIAEDGLLEVSLFANDIDGDELTFSAQADDNSIVSILDNVLTIVPTADYNGLLTITAEVTDGEYSDSTTFDVTVTPVNDAPILDFIDAQFIDEGSVLDLTLSALDIDNGDTLSYEVTSSSSSDVFVDGTQLTIIPDQNYNGNFDVTVLVSDQDGLSDSQIFTLTVNPVNDPPVIEALPNQQVAEDGSLDVSLFANDIDGDILTFSAQADDNSIVSISDNVLTIVPTSDYNGLLTITAEVSDGEFTDSTTFDVTVTPVNDAPIIDTISFEDSYEDLFYNQILSISDIDNNEDSLTLSLIESPTWLSLDGLVLSGTPNEQNIGVTEVTLSVSDGFINNSNVYNLIVIAVDDPPTLSDLNNLITNEDQSLEITLVANDEETDSELVFLVDQPSNGQLVSSSRALGFYTYTPNENYFGNDSFEYSVTDGNTTTSGIANIEIVPINDAPYFSEISLDNPIEDSSEYSFDLSSYVNDIDNDISDLEITSILLPDWLTIEDNILQLVNGQTVDEELAENLIIDISISVSDNELSTIKNLVLIVEAVNDSPDFSSASFTIFEDGQVIDIITSAIDTLSLLVELATLGIDPDDTNLIYTIPIDGQPQSGSLNTTDIENSFIEYVPNQDYNGDDSFDYQVCDDDGLCQVKEITVYIEPVNDAPTSDSFEVNVSSLSGQSFDLSEYVSDIDNDLVGGIIDFDDNNNLAFLPAPDVIDPQTLIVGLTFYGGQVQAQTTGVGYEFQYVYDLEDQDEPPCEDKLLYKVSDGLLESEPALITFAISECSRPDNNGRPGPPMGGVNQSIDLVEDTEIEVAMISFNGDPLVSESNFPTSSFDYLGSTYDSYENFCLTNDCLRIVEGQDENYGVLPYGPLSGDIDITGLDINVDPSNPSYVIMSGGYTPNSNFGDDIGIFEYIRDECFGGADSFVYQIFNPNNSDDANGGWSDEATMEFCVHGTNDQPTVVLPYDNGNINSITSHIFNEDEELTILIDFRPDELENGGYQFNYEQITLVDPDLLFNGIDITSTVSDNRINSLFTYDNNSNPNRITLTPESNLNGNFQVTLNALENYDNCQIELSDGTYQNCTDYNSDFEFPDPPLEDVGTFNISITPINDAPVVTPISNQTFIEGETLTIELSSFDVDGDTNISFSASSLNPDDIFLTLDGSNLTISTIQNYAGSTTVSVIANDGQIDSDVESFTLTIENVNDAPSFDSILNPAAVNEDENNISIQIQPTDIDGDVLSIEALSSNTSLIENLSNDSILNNSGIYTLNFDPLDNQYGVSLITVNVSDGVEIVSQQFEITVNPVNDAPVVQTINDVSLNEDESIEIALIATDIDEDNISFVIQSDVSHGSIEVNGAVVTYLPNSNYNGNDIFSFIASDSQLSSDEYSVNLVVNAVNDAPVLATLDNVSFNEDGTDSVTLSASDIDGDTLSYSVSTGTDITASLDGTDLTFSAPDDFNGSENFTVSVTDGDLTDSQVLTVTIVPVNDAPIATTGLSGETSEGIDISIQLSASDVDGDNLTYTLLSDATNGSIVIEGQLATYTPTQYYYGSDEFIFQVSDGELTDNAVVVLQVNAVNDAPVLNSIDDISFAEDNVYSLVLDAVDYDGDILNYSVSGGNLISTSIDNGTVFFNPSDNFYGIESFVITVSDGELTDIQIVVVSVLSVNDAPISNDLIVNINEDETTSIVLQANDVDGDPLNYTIINNPSGSILSIEGSIISYLPNLNFVGQDTFTFIASDGLLNSEESIVTLNVNNINDFPVIENILDSTINEDSVFTVEVNALDIDGDNLVYNFQSEENAILYFEDNILNIIPDENYYGQLIINVIVSDNILNTFSEFILDVLPVNDPPQSDDISVILNEDTSNTFSFNASDVDNFNLNYTIEQLPEHGTYEINSGFITYIPNENYYGSDELFFIVDDGELSDNGTIYIEILNVDDPFTIISSPVVNAIEDIEYQYQIEVDDPDNDNLIYNLSENAPDFMSVSNTGLILWTPTEGILTSNEITITIDDGNGNVEYQTFEVLVEPVNDLPVITSLPIENSYVDSQYIYQVQIDDPDNDVFFYELFNNPDDMLINSDGLVSWLPNKTGLYEGITIRIADSDLFEDFDEQIFNIDIKVLQNFDFLSEGNNLISFIGLDNNDNSIQSIFSPLENNLTHIFTENYASIFLDDFNNGSWFGSLDTLQSQKGYWLRLDQQDSFEIETYRFIDQDNEIEYNLHYGNNLLSYISQDVYSDIDDVLPDDIENLFTDVIGENTSATRINGEWVGSLANNGLQPLRGYWFNVSEDLNFSYSFSDILSRDKKEFISINRSELPEEFYYNQSQNQAFYFFKNIKINNVEIANDDWILGYCNEEIVGARQWFGEYTEVPIMGVDEFNETQNYCENESKVSFKVYKYLEDEIIDLDINVPNWSNLNNFIIDKVIDGIELPNSFSVKDAYPNPFNPIVNIDVEIADQSILNVNVYNIKGQLIDDLVKDKLFESGYYSLTWDASSFSSGIYFIKFRIGSKNFIKKVTLLK